VTATPKLTPLAARAHKRSLLFLFFMVIGSIGLDQVTKYHAQSTLMVWSDAENLSAYRGQRFPIWSSDGSDGAPEGSHGFVSLSTNYVRNLGAAWGALSNLPDVIRVPFFYMVTCLAVLIILLYLRSTPVHHRLAIFSLSLILSGAIGNFLDRIRFGYVIDWIDVRWNLVGWRYDFPNFNFADSCITVGVSLLLIDMLFFEQMREKATAARA
jgi:signal peptidase II